MHVFVKANARRGQNASSVADLLEHKVLVLKGDHWL